MTSTPKDTDQEKATGEKLQEAGQAMIQLGTCGLLTACLITLITGGIILLIVLAST